MATRTKKNQLKIQPKPVAAKAPKNARQPLITSGDILPMTIIFLFLFVDFIPRFDAADVMGAQWIYLIIVNVLSAVYIFTARKTISNALVAVGKNALSLIFTALFLLAAFSTFFAMDKIETMVCMARFSATFLAYFSMAVMLYNRPNFFRLFAQILSAFLLIQSVDLLGQFFANYNTVDLTTLITNLKSNSGNKNIMAASLVMKIPFAAYCIFSQKTLGKVINTIILTLGCLIIFFVNARASFVSLILVSLMVVGYIIYDHLQQKNMKLALQRAGLYFIPLVLMFIVADIILGSKKQFEEQVTGYGSVTERLATISLDQQKNSLRINQYKSALQHIKSNPLMGAGYGNWKLASIPYERSFSDEMFISYHVHNDFLEYGAELGIPGLLLYLGLYICMVFFGLRVLFSRSASSQLKQMAAFSLMALTVYFIDAMFNFPIERPIMQMYLAFIMALHATIFIAWKRSQTATQSETTQKRFNWTAPAFAVLMIALLAPSFYYARQVYISMIAQGKYNGDMLSGSPVYKSAEVIPALPDVPDLNVFGFPIKAIKARYLLAEKKYDEALKYLRESDHVNPYISYNEFLKGNLFLERGMIDSAYLYARKCFYMKPRAKSNYQLLMAVLAQKKDSAEATKAFKEAVQFRDEHWVWAGYIDILYISGKDYKTLHQLADSAAKKFPADKDLQNKAQYFASVQNQPR